MLGGAVTVLGVFHNHDEELVAKDLAASVPGVRSVVVQPCVSPA